MKEDNELAQHTRPVTLPCVGYAQSSFYSGDMTHPIYADVLMPTQPLENKLPLILIHGAFHTGTAFLTTPDGRPGWAPYFANRGRRSYVIDWPGHGRSPAGVNFHKLSGLDVARSMGRLIEEVGPCVLLAHSAGGPIAWQLAESHSEQVKAIVGVAPGGPANIQKALSDDPDAIAALRFDQEAGCPIYSDPTKTFYVDIDFVRDYWANTPRFPAAALERYARSIVGESPQILNERFRIGGAGLLVNDPAAIGRRPILIVTGEQDPRHPRATDERLALYFDADFCFLPDVGITGNGHMLMLDDNSDDIARRIDDWLEKKGI